MSFPGNLISSLGGTQAVAITAGIGLAVGAAGAATVGGAFTGPPDRTATLPIYACPDTGPELARVPAGQRMLITGKTADGTWLRIHFPAPDRSEAWVEAAPLELQGTLEEIPTATCRTTALAVPSGSPAPVPSFSEVLVPGFSFPPGGGPSSSPGPTASATPSNLPQDPNAPTVTLVPPGPTNKSTAVVEATFSTGVTDLEPSDFSLTGGPAASCTVKAIDTVSETVYRVKVGCTKDGTVSLVLGAVSVQDAGGTAGPSVPVSASVTFDREAPRASVIINSGSPTKATRLTSVATFSEPVKSVVAADFALAGTAKCGSGAVARQSPNTFAFSFTCTKSGSVTVSLRAGTAVDNAGNPGPARTAVSNTVVIDLAGPSVKSFAPEVTATKLLSVAYKLVFSEAVSGLAPGDFSFKGSSAKGCSVAIPTASGTTFAPKVTCTGTGTVVLTLTANRVTDGVGNEGPAKAVAAAAVSLDQTPPGASIAAPPSPTTSLSPVFTVGFTEPVTGLAAGDFEIGAKTTQCTVGSVAPVAGDPVKFSVTLSCTSTTGGFVFLRLLPGSVTDLAGNAGPSAVVASTTIKIDSVPPSIARITCGTCSLTAGTKGIVGVSAFVTDLSGIKSVKAIVTVPGGGSTYDVVMTQPEPGGVYRGTLANGNDATGTYRFKIEATDAVGNVALSDQFTFSIISGGIFLGPVGSVDAAPTSGGGATGTALAALPFGFPLLALALLRRRQRAPLPEPERKETGR